MLFNPSQRRGQRPRRWPQALDRLDPPAGALHLHPGHGSYRPGKQACAAWREGSFMRTWSIASYDHRSARLVPRHTCHCDRPLSGNDAQVRQDPHRSRLRPKSRRYGRVRQQPLSQYGYKGWMRLCLMLFIGSSLCSTSRC